MTEFTEKRYSIDPGKGKKMPGCPYSIYEDGRDVKDYIIPPKGHVFVGFKYDPDASNQIYDGKLTAEYAKEPFLTRLKSNIWMLVLVLAIALVIGIVILLAFSVFKDPKPSTPKTKDVKPKTEITNNKKEKKDKKEKKTAEKATNKPKQAEETAPVQAQPEAKAPVEEQPATAISTVEQTTNVPSQQPAATDPNEVFKRDFWTLVHEKSGSMDAYTDLYNANKTKVAGEEFDYLRYTILKDFVTFKAWYDKLKKIPEKELNSIKTIEALRKSVG